MKILICGNRMWRDAKLVGKTIDELVSEFGRFAVVEGGASGADTIARQQAIKRGIPVIEVKADWKTYVGSWALDSGGFSELSLYGQWQTSPYVYIGYVYRYQEEIGNLEWAAPQDWMCEPHILAKTRLTVEQHQQLTVRNFLQLNFVASELPFIPVLQGWTLDDYERCLEMYAVAGINLQGSPLVGVGSVCRRQATSEIEAIMARLESYGLKLHGFGVKRDGLALYSRHLTSADSMAWSFNARWEDPLPGCRHKHCNNCIKYALAWRERRLKEDKS